MVAPAADVEGDEDGDEVLGPGADAVEGDHLHTELHQHQPSPHSASPRSPPGRRRWCSCSPRCWSRTRLTDQIAPLETCYDFNYIDDKWQMVNYFIKIYKILNKP